ncbi:MAG: tetratricopeptide repeat protein [Armatimonadetes bacterium]|nr:tetratricopeptide repeat protein [Armatimonadota bacterium]
MSSVHAGRTCPYCQTAIEPGESVTVCPTCGIPHHTECWEDNSGCTVFGCASGPTASSSRTNTDAYLPYETPMSPVGGMGFGTDEPRVYMDSEPFPAEIGRRILRLCLYVIVYILIRLILTSLGSDPKSEAVDCFEQGFQYQTMCDFTGAILQYQKALQIDPEMAAAYFAMGQAYLGIGDDNTENISDLIEAAKRGDTSALDNADRCFAAAVDKVVALSSGEKVRVGNTVVGSREDFLGAAYAHMGLTAVLRVVSNVKAHKVGDAQQWAVTAHQYFKNALQYDTSNRLARDGIDMLRGTGH